jgi:arrestin-1
MKRLYLFAECVVLIDPEYLVHNKKVFGQVVCCFRYGREEDEVMGLTFQKELYLASEQIYPPAKKDVIMSKLQVRP